MAGRYDVVVVGGRLAGASTAMLLARAGARVALVDRSPYGSDTVSTHALMRAGVLQLSRWGVLDEVATVTPAVRKTSFHYGTDDPVQVSILPSPGVDALYAPRRHRLDRALVDAAAAAGVDVLHGLAVTGLLPGPGDRVGGVRARRRDGRGLSLAAPLTVGADGVRSVVAAEAGAAVERVADTTSAILYAHFDDLPVAGYEFAYGQGASAGLIPTDDGQTCVFVATSPQRMRQLRRLGADTAFQLLLTAAAPRHVDRVLDASRPAGLHGWSGVPGFVRRASGPGWALVGDAGYFKDPVTAHGMTDALRDAELLADAVLAGLSGSRTEAVALAGYQQLRDRLSSRLFRATTEVARFAWDPDHVHRLLREVSAAMTDEVEELQGRPHRRDSRHSSVAVDAVGPGRDGFIRPDTAAGRR
ncbi:MAG TPA: FAD-dependent monooxygenase [Nocardioidaceae bacterium]|jgi:2-polyprenyl-6-methoxyphenol hydroxylase-like FAD-dependent oxidoreductase